MNPVPGIHIMGVLRPLGGLRLIVLPLALHLVGCATGPDRILPTQEFLRQRELHRKAPTLVLARVDFENVPITEAALQLMRLSRNVDPDHQGIQITTTEVEGWGDHTELPRVTLHLRDIPVIKAVRVMTELCGLKYRLSEGYIHITTTCPGRIPPPETRTFVLSPKGLGIFRKKTVPEFQTNLAELLLSKPKDFMDYFALDGDWPLRASVDRETGTLTVKGDRNTLDHLERILDWASLSDAELDSKAKARVTKIHRILDELTFDAVRFRGDDLYQILSLLDREVRLFDPKSHVFLTDGYWLLGPEPRKISLDLHGVSLRTILATIARDQRLGCLVCEGGVIMFPRSNPTRAKRTIAIPVWPSLQRAIELERCLADLKKRYGPNTRIDEGRYDVVVITGPSSSVDAIERTLNSPVDGPALRPWRSKRGPPNDWP